MILTHLLARQVHTHPATPNVLYVTGWDDLMQQQVCWIVMHTYDGSTSINAAYGVACELMSNPEMLSWLTGLAYVDCQQSPLSNYDIDLSMTITHHQHAQLAAEAEAQS